jgi:hypothetical protein
MLWFLDHCSALFIDLVTILDKPSEQPPHRRLNVYYFFKGAELRSARTGPFDCAQDELRPVPTQTVYKRKSSQEVCNTCISI